MKIPSVLAFLPRQDESPRQQYQIYMVTATAIFIIIGCLVLTLYALLERPRDTNIYIIAGMIAGTQGLVLWLIHRRSLQKAGWVNIMVLWVGIGYGSYVSGGVYASAVTLFLIPLILSVILLGTRITLVLLIATLIFFGFLVFVEVNGALPVATARDLPYRLMVIGGNTIFIVVLFMYHMIKMREAEDKNTQLSLQAERLQVQQQLTQDLAHDLRTPLAILNTQTYLIKKRLDNGENITPYMERLETYSQKLDQMIDGFFQLTRLDSDYQPDTWQNVDLAYLLPLIADQFQDYAHRQHIHLDVDIARPLDHYLVYGEASLLQRAIENLIENGIRYGKAKGEVCLKLSHEAEFVHLKVTDDGRGIAPEEQTKIFDRFYRVNDARTMDEKTGTGIGLSIVKRIVEIHGGDIQVTSTINQGSEFSVRLPFSPFQLAQSAKMS